MRAVRSQGGQPVLVDVDDVPGESELLSDMQQAAEMLAARPELADALITHRYPLEDAPEAFRVAADRPAGSIEVVVEVD